MISINIQDDAKTISKYKKESKFTFPFVMDTVKNSVAGKYKVQATPTNYLVDKNGKILARYVGANEIALRAALKKAGFKL